LKKVLLSLGQIFLYIEEQFLLIEFSVDRRFQTYFVWLFVTLYAKSTYKMPRQHTSNPKIPKVSKAIGSPFY
jgi:hypothetical protein